MLPLTAGTRPVIGGAHGMVPAFQIAVSVTLSQGRHAVAHVKGSRSLCIGPVWPI